MRNETYKLLQSFQILFIDTELDVRHEMMKRVKSDTEVDVGYELRNDKERTVRQTNRLIAAFKIIE